MGQFLCRPSHNTKKNIARPPITERFPANPHSKANWESLYGSPYPTVEESSSASSSTCTVNSPNLSKSSIRSVYNQNNAQTSISHRNNPYSKSAPYTSRNSFSSVSRLQALSYKDVVAAKPPRLAGPHYLDHHEPFTVFETSHHSMPRPLSLAQSENTPQPFHYTTNTVPIPSASRFHSPPNEQHPVWRQEQGDNYKGYPIVKGEIVTTGERNPRGKSSSIRSNSISSNKPNTHSIPPFLSVSRKERHAQSPSSGDVHGQTSDVYAQAIVAQSRLDRQQQNNNEMYASYGYPPIYHGPNPTHFLAENVSDPPSEARGFAHHQAIDDTIIYSTPHTHSSRPRPTTRTSTRALPSG